MAASITAPRYRFQSYEAGGDISSPIAAMTLETFLGLKTSRRAALTVFLTVAGLYLLTAHYHSGQVSDTQAAIWPAWNWVHHGTFFLDHTAHLPAHEWFVHANGHTVSNRMMGVVLLGIPICALLSWTSRTPTELNAINGALLAALAITLLFLALRRLTHLRLALSTTALIAFGTAAWTVASAETWPQTADALFLAGMLYALSSDRLWWAGLALSAAVLARPHIAIVALVLGVGLAIQRSSVKPALAFGGPATAAFGVLLVWNHWVFGRWQLLGAYQAHLQTLTGSGPAVPSYPHNLAGAFFSPQQGLFVLTPLALLAVLWLVTNLRSTPVWTRLALLGGLGYEALQLRLDSYTGGGGFFGSRLTIELVVLATPAALVSYVAWSARSVRRRAVASGLAAIGVATFTVGAFLAYYLIGTSARQEWTVYYPWRVLQAAGIDGLLVGFVVLCCALLFAATRVRTLRSPAPVGVEPVRRAIPAARQPVASRPVRMALVHEWLDGTGGSEQVFDELGDIFDGADRWALWASDSYRANARPVMGSRLEGSRLQGHKRAALPLMPLAWRSLPERDYDVVLSSSHCFAHTVRFRSCVPTIYLSYVYAPMRYVWTPELDSRAAGPWASPARAAARYVDKRMSDHVSAYAAISEEVRQRIQRCWDRDATVIYPSVDVDFWKPSPSDEPPFEQFVLGVGRWVGYKRFDLILATAEAAGLPVVIAGGGPDERLLREQAAALRVPVRFVLSPTREQLRALYSQATALIFPVHEDFGLVPVEAMACGTPVVARGRGGALETVREGIGGWLCDDLSPQTLAELVQRCDGMDRTAVRKSVLHLGGTRFADEMRAWVAQFVPGGSTTNALTEPSPVQLVRS